MKTPFVGSGYPPGAPLAASAILSGGLGDLGNSNMCNKICIGLSVPPHVLPSRGAPPRTSAPGRILFPTGSSGIHDIWSFLPSHNLTSCRATVAQSVDAAIALQEAKEAATKTARVARRNALQEKIEEAAHKKACTTGERGNLVPGKFGLSTCPGQSVRGNSNTSKCGLKTCQGR